MSLSSKVTHLGITRNLYFSPYLLDLKKKKIRKFKVLRFLAVVHFSALGSHTLLVWSGLFSCKVKGPLWMLWDLFLFIAHPSPVLHKTDAHYHSQRDLLSLCLPCPCEAFPGCALYKVHLPGRTLVNGFGKTAKHQRGLPPAFTHRGKFPQSSGRRTSLWQRGRWKKLVGFHV